MILNTFNLYVKNRVSEKSYLSHLIYTLKLLKINIKGYILELDNIKDNIENSENIKMLNEKVSDVEMLILNNKIGDVKSLKSRLEIVKRRILLSQFSINLAMLISRPLKFYFKIDDVNVIQTSSYILSILTFLF